LVKNCQVRSHTKHIDIHHLFDRELQQQKILVGKFVQSVNNMADGAMKNFPEKIIHCAHVEIEDQNEID